MPFSIERNDLANVSADVIVVPANEGLQINGGTGLAVARVAGLERMQAACDALGGCPTGSAVATPAFDLDARYVVHAVGPVWQGDAYGERAILRRTYDAALGCAARLGARTVALPLISAHTFGFPAGISFAIAIDAIRAFLNDHDVDVRLVLFGSDAYAVGIAQFGDVAAYIDDCYVEGHYDGTSSYPFAQHIDEPPLQAPPLQGRPSYAPSPQMSGQQAPFPQAPPQQTPPTETLAPSPKAPAQQARLAQAPSSRPGRTGAFPAVEHGSAPAPAARDAAAGYASAPAPAAREAAMAQPQDAAFEESCDAQMAQPQSRPSDLASWLDKIDDSFSTTLLALIDLRGLTDAQVYKRANMSRQLFSKIRSDAGYRPTKKTVLALAIALKLDLQETSDLLKRAGFALSHSSKADIIVEYFIINRTYDIFAINEALYAFDQPLL